MLKKRVVVAMSGGVDSSVAAALLKEQGFDVVGISMQLWNHGDESSTRFDSCCSLTDIHDARMVAHKLAIPHYFINYEQEFRKGVVDYFASEYDLGRTPNPCVMCNSQLKFDHLIAKAQMLNADYVATGHYAKIEHYGGNRISSIYQGDDSKKDQSYFLFGIKKQMLRHILFPVGDLTKSQVREIAAQFGLHTSQKKESQEICFVSAKRYTEFLEKHYPDHTKKAGYIIDRSGKIVGEHDGIYKYTVGQRKGLNLSVLKPQYVAAIDPNNNVVVVDDLEKLACDQFVISAVNWLVDADEIDDYDDIVVQVRYHSKPISARVEYFQNDQWTVYLGEPAAWITPGQAAVFYRQRQLLGGGFITNPLATAENRDQRQGISLEVRA